QGWSPRASPLVPQPDRQPEGQRRGRHRLVRRGRPRGEGRGARPHLVDAEGTLQGVRGVRGEDQGHTRHPCHRARARRLSPERTRLRSPERPGILVGRPWSSERGRPNPDRRREVAVPHVKKAGEESEGTQANPWVLSTPPGSSEYTAYR